MTIPGLSEGFIRQKAMVESFLRWQDYHRREAVLSLVRENGALEAEPRGSGHDPYRVCVTFDRNGVTQAECSCPYDWGGWCKHIVATLLACLHWPDTVEAHPLLQELLAGLDHDQSQPGPVA
jgi:uncharacterized Zn finger protein